MELLAQTREMLDKCRGRWPEVAARSGLSYPWISKFSRGLFANPGVLTLHYVHETLGAMLYEKQAASDKARQD